MNWQARGRVAYYRVKHIPLLEMVYLCQPDVLLWFFMMDIVQCKHTASVYLSCRSIHGNAEGKKLL